MDAIHNGVPYTCLVMKITRDSIQNAVFSLLETNAKKASVYLDEFTVVTATAMHKPDKRMRVRSVMLTMGRPNYRGRMFVKACKKAGKLFPIREAQLKFWPKKK